MPEGAFAMPPGIPKTATLVARSGSGVRALVRNEPRAALGSGPEPIWGAAVATAKAPSSQDAPKEG
eukprot:3526121-Alexandrium_andersonii.AAC.1